MRYGLLAGWVVLAVANAATARTQDSVPTAELTGIEHTPSPCMDTEAFPLIEARASDVSLAQRARGLIVHFKAETDTGWYEVAFGNNRGALFQAALPKPLPEASRIAYYITTEDRRERSPQYLVNVLMGGCPGARGAPPALVDDIEVRRTSDEQSPTPLGFDPEGIRVGSEISRMTVGLVAAAAGGAGLAAIALRSDSGAPDVGNLPPVNPDPLRACFNPDPIPDIRSGGTIRFNAACTTPAATVTSYLWNFGDTTSATGSSVEHLFRPGGVYSVTLTVSDGQRTDSITRVIRVRATPNACFLTTPDPPRITANESINFNAECSVGDRDGGAVTITKYEWDFGDRRPGTEGVFVSRQFEPDVYGVTLTVTNEDGLKNSKTQFVVVEAAPTGTQEYKPTNNDGPRSLTFTSHLEFPGDGQAKPAQGLIQLNEIRAVTTASATPTPQRMAARPRSNDMEARLLTVAGRPGKWQFDFAAAPGFVAGSLHVVSGQVLSLDSRRIVFRDSAFSRPNRALPVPARGVTFSSIRHARKIVGIPNRTADSHRPGERAILFAGIRALTNPCPFRPRSYYSNTVARRSWRLWAQARTS